MPTHRLTSPHSPDPLSDARDLHASIAALRHLLMAQSRQFAAIDRRLSLARSPAEASDLRLRLLKAERV